jgi:hypothetical protein
MDYQLVYEASQTSADWHFVAIGPVFVILGLLMVVFRGVVSRVTGRSSTYVTVFGSIFLGFSLLWTLIASVSLFGSNSSMSAAARDSSTSMVEGPVEDFHPGPDTGHEYERFHVGVVHFAYSDYMITGGFNRTQSHGGPIRSGLNVRIRYVGTADKATIVKLEIKP